MKTTFSVLTAIAMATTIFAQNTLITDGNQGPMENGGYVLLSPQGKIVNDFKHVSQMGKPYEGLMVAFDKVSGKMGYLDAQTGAWGIKPQFEMPYINFECSFSDGLAILERPIHGSDDKEYGVIDKTGKLVIPFSKGAISSFHEGLAAKKDPENDDKYGFIDHTGKWAIPSKWDIVKEGFKDGMAAVAKDFNDVYKYGFIDKTGKLITDYQWEEVREFQDGLAAVSNSEKDRKYGFIDKTGNLVIEYQFTKVYSDFENGLAIVFVPDGKKGENAGEFPNVIDKTGKSINKSTFEYIMPYSEGLAAVLVAGQNGNTSMGFIDKTGKLVIPAKFNKAEGNYSEPLFSQGLCAVSNGYIDTKGVLVIKFPKRGHLEDVGQFKNGVALLKIYNKDAENPVFKYTAIDKTGKILYESPDNF